MTPKLLILIGAITISVSNMISSPKANNIVKIEDLYLEPRNGTFILHANCLNTFSNVVLTDSTASIEVTGGAPCYGDYGQATIQKDGNNVRLLDFKATSVVKGKPQRIEKMYNYPDGLYAKISVEGKEPEVVKITVTSGISNYVIKTDKGYERI